MLLPWRQGRARWGLAIAATLGMTVSYIDRQTLAAVAPAVKAALGIDHAQYGWLLSAFSIAYLVGAPLAGILVDRLGARRGFALAVVVWSIVAGTHAFVATFVGLFALRILLGAAEAPSFPSAAQAIRRALPGAQRPLAYGLLFTGSSIGAVVAAKFAVGIEARYGFRFAFVFTALAGTVWLPLWLAASRGLDSDPPTEPIAAKSTPPPPRARWRDVVTSAPVLRTIVAVVGSAPLTMFTLNWTSQYLVEAWRFQQADVGNYLMVAPIAFDVGAVGFGWLASLRERTEREPRTHVDLVLVSLLLAASLGLAPLAPNAEVAIALFGASACGGGGIYVLSTADMLARVPLEKTSSAGGMAAAAQSLAHIVAGPLVGGAIDRAHGYTLVLVALGIGVVPTSLAFAFWPGLGPSPAKRA